MKGADWTAYSPPSDCSWSWRKISQILTLFAPAYTNNLWLNSAKPYTVHDGYNWLRQVKPEVPWRFLCWNKLNIPKSSFIFWAFQHQRLLTKDRLQRMGLLIDGTCDVCNILPEDHRHLFHVCTYSTACWHILHQKLHITFPLDNLVTWFSAARLSKMQKRFIGACHVYMFYFIWKVRNEARIKSYVRRPEAVVQMVLRDIKARLFRCNTSKLKQRDAIWFQQL
ncbi:uncharacterized protein LOC141631981 [Silene latifolia]|uniref:uncharacterized protein LOC141631981 n=1 Tax=Silene latifolia TaxID=37657 RepID=UPI003D77CC96